MPSLAPTETSNFRRLAARIRGLVGKAIADFGMIGEGDRVMVCLSGGKDSYTLLDMLLSLQRSRAGALRAGGGQPRPEAARLSRARAAGLPALPGRAFHVIEQDTYSVVRRVIPEGKTQCGLCSRLRRGALYRYARENGITRIALGHHRDDIVETLFLNMFHGGRLKAMPPKLLSEDGSNVVIRPLAYVPEREIARYARARASRSFPASSAARSRTCSARPWRACWRSGTASTRAASIRSSRRCATSRPRISWIRCRISARFGMAQTGAAPGSPGPSSCSGTGVAEDGPATCAPPADTPPWIARPRYRRPSTTPTGSSPGRLLAGEYPGGERDEDARASVWRGCWPRASTASST
jgi:tRNA 2-thiocytidine biosynthesis protein TtcA